MSSSYERMERNSDDTPLAGLRRLGEVQTRQRPTAERKRKPHPARRARRLVGAAGTAGMLVMTGYMTVNAAQPAAADAATGSVATVSSTSATTRATTSALSRAAAPATTPITSSKTS